MLPLTAENHAVRLRQMQIHMGLVMCKKVAALFETCGQVPAEARLPLLSIALPGLRKMIPTLRGRMLQTLTMFAQADQHIDLHEYCMLRLLRLYIKEIAVPAGTRMAGVARLYDLRYDYAKLCGIVAAQGGMDEGSARQVWQEVMERAIPGHGIPYPEISGWQTIFGVALDHLDQLRPSEKKIAIEGLCKVVLFDRAVTLEEAELLRVVCACLHCPLPPFVDAVSIERKDPDERWSHTVAID